jgi:hypothetical protein
MLGDSTVNSNYPGEFSPKYFEGGRSGIDFLSSPRLVVKIPRSCDN